MTTQIFQYARKMRCSLTSAERSLWNALRGKSMGVRAHRQKVIDYYIVDFCIPKWKLIIEVDGGYHLHPDQIAKDKKRQCYLEGLGYKVIRFTNDEVLDNLPQVLEVISLQYKKPRLKRVSV